MSEKQLTPLDIMPAALRHSLTTILAKYQHLDQNPSAASSSSLSKPYEALKSLWAELQWTPYADDEQQLEAQWRTECAANLQRRTEKLMRKKQRWAQKKQKWRSSLRTRQRTLTEKQRLLSLTSAELIAEQLLSYESEWTSAEQRIETQKQQLRQAENRRPTTLQQHKQTLRDAFNKLKHSLNEQQPTVPQRLRQLQQQNAEYRSALPGLVATWKNAASERETRLRDELESWNAKHPILSEEVPTWDDLQTSWQQLNDYRQSLNDWNQQLQQRKTRMSSAELTMHAKWQRVSTKPSFSALPSSEQRMDWLRKLRPLKELLSDLRQLTTRCALLKAELLTAGFLGADEYPEIDAAWATMT